MKHERRHAPPEQPTDRERSRVNSVEDDARSVYASAAPVDDTLCNPLVNALRRRLLAVWYDRDAARDNRPLGEQALRRLRRDHAFLLFLSPGALASPRVRLEAEAYGELLAQEPGRLFIIVRVAACDVPPELADLPLVDVVAVGVEPAAVELARLIYGAPPRGSHAPPTSSATLDELGFGRATSGNVGHLLPPLRSVPEGYFIMGSDPRHDPWAHENETPQHRVFLRAFAIGQYPVTVAEYARAVAAGAVEPPRSSGGVTWEKQLARPTHPAVCVSWAAAHAYATWLAERAGDPWRLATEAEWERAARGVDGRRYPWGDVWDPTRANTSDGGPDDTTPVDAYGERGASPYGAWDMAGNVWEWTSTLARPYPYDAGDGRESPTAPGNRVARGGSYGGPLRYWRQGPRNARATQRGLSLPNWSNGTANTGFRLALDE